MKEAPTLSGTPQQRKTSQNEGIQCPTCGLVVPQSYETCVSCDTVLSGGGSANNGEKKGLFGWGRKPKEAPVSHPGGFKEARPYQSPPPSAKDQPPRRHAGTAAPAAPIKRNLDGVVKEQQPAAQEQASKKARTTPVVIKHLGQPLEDGTALPVPAEAKVQKAAQQATNQAQAGVLPAQEATLRAQEAAHKERAAVQKAEEAAVKEQAAVNKALEAAAKEHEALIKAQQAGAKEKEAIERGHQAAAQEQETIRKVQEATAREQEAIRKAQEAVAREQESIRKAQEAEAREQSAIKKAQEAAALEKESISKAQQAQMLEQEALRKAQDAAAREQESIKRAEEATVQAQEAAKKAEEARLKQEETARKEQEVVARIEHEAVVRRQEAARKEQEAAIKQQEATRREQEVALRQQEAIRREEVAARKQQEAELKQQEAARKEEQAVRAQQAAALDIARQRDEVMRREAQALAKRGAAGNSQDPNSWHQDAARIEVEAIMRGQQLGVNRRSHATPGESDAYAPPSLEYDGEESVQSEDPAQAAGAHRFMWRNLFSGRTRKVAVLLPVFIATASAGATFFFLTKPGDEKHLNQQGMVELSQRRFAAAVKDLEQASTLNPKDGKLALALAQAYLGVDQVDKAWECVSRAQQLGQGLASYPALATDLANYYRVRGQFGKAADLLRPLAQADVPGKKAELADLVAAQGDDQIREGKLEAALRCWEEVKELNQGARVTEAPARLATIYRKLAIDLANDRSGKMDDQALGYLTKLSDASNPQDLQLAAKLYEKQGKLDDAIEQLKKANQIDSQDILLKHKLVQLLKRRGKELIADGKSEEGKDLIAQASELSGQKDDASGTQEEVADKDDGKDDTAASGDPHKQLSMRVDQPAENSSAPPAASAKQAQSDTTPMKLILPPEMQAEMAPPPGAAKQVPPPAAPAAAPASESSQLEQ